MPTNQVFNKDYYFNYKDIYLNIARNIFKKKVKISSEKKLDEFNDTPDKKFSGPF